jgi:hypothetical protein
VIRRRVRPARELTIPPSAFTDGAEMSVQAYLSVLICPRNMANMEEAAERQDRGDGLRRRQRAALRRES